MSKTLITKESIKQFRSLVIQATSSLVTLKDQRVALDIPDSVYEKAFRSVFNGDLVLAKDILFGRLERINTSEATEQIDSIATLSPAAMAIADAIESKEPILMISDIDADGSLAQSIGMELRRETGADLVIQSKMYDPAVHGFSIDQISEWMVDHDIAQDSVFSVIVTDLGSNQSDVQALFLSMFPQGKLIIVDHHRPDPDLKVEQQTSRSWWVSPFTEGSALLALRNGGGVSAGYLFYSLTEKVLKTLQERQVIRLEPAVLASRIDAIRKMGMAANLLDGVQSDTRLKPLYEEDVKKAIDLSGLTRVGRGIEKWIRDDQAERIKDLLPIMGESVIDELLTIRHRYKQQNHYAGALLSTIRDVMTGEFKLPEGGVAELVLTRVAQGDIEDSAQVNYIAQMRPWMFNMAYESRAEPDVKKTWFSLAETCMKNIKNIDRQVLEQIRAFELVRQVSSEHVIITQSTSKEVELVFSPRELKNAYSTSGKAVNMSVSAQYPDRLVLTCNSEVSMFQLLATADEMFPFATLKYQGNNGAGGLTITPRHDVAVQDLIEPFVTFMQHRVNEVQAESLIVDPILVNPIHLPLLQEMMTKMRLHIESYAAPTLLMEITADTVFEDKYSLKKTPVSALVEGKPWEVTTDTLDFGHTLKLMLPNQVLRQMLAQGYQGAVQLSLLNNGHFIAKRSVSPAQIAMANVAQLTLPIERDQQEMIKFYQQNFEHKDDPTIPLTAEEIANALHFTSDGAKVQEQAEAIILSVLKKTGANAKLILDVEADGAGNAQCFNYGLFNYKRDPQSGTVLSREAYAQMVAEQPDEIRNFEVLPDGNIRINEVLQKSLTSVVIGTDGQEPIVISSKSQALTNFSQDFIDQHGMSSVRAQEIVLKKFKDADGTFIIQAHNLPYDNNIFRVNFPEAYQVMQDNIHLDTAVLSRENQIAYMNMSVSQIGKVAFYNAPHQGYNLSSLLENPTLDSFDFPSIKGTHVLKVRGDEVVLFNKKNRLSTKLPQNRADLAVAAKSEMGLMPSPRYSIQLLMRIATIHDMLSSMPIKFVKEVAFDSYGLEFPAGMWHRIQHKYAYDRSIDDNLMLLMQIPDVRHFMEETVKFKSLLDVPDELAEARRIGTGDMYNPKRECKTEKDQAAHAERLLEFSGLYIVRANLIRFLNNNPQNAERYARAWLYDLVLERHEMTRKHLDPGMLEGLSEETGVSPQMLEDLYGDVYRYCEKRGIQSYRAHETHNNIGLDGDVVQEVHVFLHMMQTKMSNPYIPREVMLARLMDPNAPVVEMLVKQSARSTMMQLVRKITGISVDGEVVPINSYSGRQLENFSKAGVSELTRRLDDSNAQFKCKTLSEDKTEVRVNLPEVDKQAFLSLPEDERRHLEELVELGISGIVISNSSDAKGLSASTIATIERTGAHPAVLAALKTVSERFGTMEATSRADEVKKLMKQLTDATLGLGKMSLSANREIMPDDLKIAEETFTIAIEMLRNRGFQPHLTEEDIKGMVRKASGEYYCNQEAKRTGEKVHELPASKTKGILYDVMEPAAKSSQTRMINAMARVDKKFSEISPGLASSVLTTKKDPVQALLRSPLVCLAMHSSEVGLQQDLRMVINHWPKEALEASYRARQTESPLQLTSDTVVKKLK